ncbi:MAG: tRNA ((37)-N6)-dimethylallyltransferase MiaA [Burkholderiales bacterium]|jgi:tRNA dimethylallyltransferase|nr:tRNA ((37)-N6)-dimethylallyltransferase MiaA [Burkholderiales bacterium]
MGPTATGKTDLALKLAEELPIEIISVDSALIYQGMDIGAAKPSTEEQNRVKHHLIDIITPLESYSVAHFIDDSVRLIYEINARGKIPLLVGGTIMYYNGLLNGISELPLADPKIRAQLELEANSSSWQVLHSRLQQIDPIAATKIKPNDKQRISRALEIFYQTGKPISVLQSQSNIKKSAGINFLPLAIIPEKRDILHKRIATRFNKMLENGFIEEVQNLRSKFPELTSNHTSMRCVGYNRVWQYLEGQISKKELYEQGIAATRQLAKRQITWLRSMNVTNLDTDCLDYKVLYANFLGYIKNFI